MSEPALFELEASSAALLSDDGLYRYWLTRRWAEGPRALFVMLNPSTADAQVDDPTIRRCVGFAKGCGCGSLVVVNLYAYRATSPADMLAAADPVGPECDRWIESWAERVDGPRVVAWGANARPARVAEFRYLTQPHEFDALGVTKDGQPRHPLYLRADSQLQPWPAPLAVVGVVTDQTWKD